MINEAIAVDASCPGNPGPMEYQGIHLPSGRRVFHFGPMQGTNNIGEFLAIVHALALLKRYGKSMTIYTDSATALAWIRKRRCGTKIERSPQNEELFNLISRAENWLRTNTFADCPIVKWQTSEWGEIPADFGRK